ncbi:MAG: Pyridoxine/pyridoxamine 5'-phosphate oxidase [Chlamydiae bacterium]|nr:Pyridoxine/pyridoxamine 5'-phosphate oxidase [Chlamydiota bacterium]
MLSQPPWVVKGEETASKSRMNFNDLSKDYAEKNLRRRDLNVDPYLQLLQWFDEAKAVNVAELNTMSLATATATGKPSCRLVLLKQIDERSLIFYTNYESRKSKELTENPFAMITIFWHEQVRQICVEGTVEKISEEESQAYFSIRSRASQIGAWASRQDKAIPSREVLEAEFTKFEKQFEGQQEVPLPSFWGGFRLIPNRFEFWQGGGNRLHDRFHYILQNDKWVIERLSP